MICAVWQNCQKQKSKFNFISASFKGGTQKTLLSQAHHDQHAVTVLIFDKIGKALI
jgi:hypothetical protein